MIQDLAVAFSQLATFIHSDEAVAVLTAAVAASTPSLLFDAAMKLIQRGLRSRRLPIFGAGNISGRRSTARPPVRLAERKNEKTDVWMDRGWEQTERMKRQTDGWIGVGRDRRNERKRADELLEYVAQFKVKSWERGGKGEMINVRAEDREDSE